MTLILAAIAIIVGFVSLIFAAVGLVEWISVVRQGARAADRAYLRGDTLSTYFDPSKTRPVEGPQHDARAALAGRRSRRFGVVAVSEHAPDHA